MGRKPGKEPSAQSTVWSRRKKEAFNQNRMKKQEFKNNEERNQLFPVWAITKKAAMSILV